MSNFKTALFGILCACVLVWPLNFSPAQAEEFVLSQEIVDDLVPQKAADALAQIPDTGRKLLALRAYVRSHKRIEERWSWTASEIKTFQGSPKQKALLAEVEAIKSHFAQNNPGYEIFANTRVRSLDVQIKNWNKNKSVGRAGSNLLAVWKQRFGEHTFKDRTVNAKTAQRWLAGAVVKPRAPLAAPGLTLHGRASAIDFQVMKSGMIIAGANSGHIKRMWQDRGWNEKLNASVTAAGPSFQGPLKRPYEPWHYDYKPDEELSTKAAQK